MGRFRSLSDEKGSKRGKGFSAAAHTKTDTKMATREVLLSLPNDVYVTLGALEVDYMARCEESEITDV